MRGLELIRTDATYQPGNPMLAAGLTLLTQVLQDSGGAVNTMTGNKEGSNQAQKSCIFLSPIRNRMVKPGVVPSTGYAENSTHGLNAALVYELR
jgi:hypothetical protein